jgi:glycerol-3-phosphate dehydrogenase (NAD(P)+)
MNKKVVVIGAGSWGTALAVLLAGNGCKVTLWGYRNEQIEVINKERENRKYLPGILFPESVYVEERIENAIESAVFIIFAVPSHAFREIFERISTLISKNCFLISAIKGVENKTLLTITQVMEDVIRQNTLNEVEFNIGVISGPSFAKEVALGIPTAVTIAFRNEMAITEAHKIFSREFFRVYASNDVLGIEICAATKNVIAIASGICDGLGYGLNTRAALITRGLAEIKRLGKKFNAKESTFSGLSGLGDLILTCTGDLSRNRMLGIKLGSGKKTTEIVNEMTMVAEGIKTTKSIYDLAKKHEIEMPITEQVHEIIYNNKECSKAVEDLLKREAKFE